MVNYYLTFKGKLTNPTPVTISYTDSLGNKYASTVEIHPSKAPVCPYLNKLVNFVQLTAL